MTDSSIFVPFPVSRNEKGWTETHILISEVNEERGERVPLVRMMQRTP